MSKNTNLEVKKLALDLKNFRTVPQKNELDAIKAMIAISPDRFYAVLESILDEGYTPTENIIVLEESGKNVVKEGNRRVACLKIIQGEYNISEFTIPAVLVDKISSLDTKWKKENSSVPCMIYSTGEEDKADRVVSLTHGKGEKANREKWSSVATARHNRDAKGTAEPALDLLEKYLISGNNLTNQQKERWAGDFPLTVLHEAMRSIHHRLGYVSLSKLVDAYPKVENISNIDDMLRDIGLELLQFKHIRDLHTDFALLYGVAPIIVSTPTTPKAQPTTPPTPTPPPTPTTPPSPTSGPTPSPAGGPTPSGTQTPPAPAPVPSPPAFAINDPRRVTAMLKRFTPKGNRDKIVTLKDEILSLNLKKNPIAFCFLLRSMFEISAKAYCDDNSLPTTKATKTGPRDRSLLELLTEVTNHLTNNNKNKPVVKVLTGALTDLGKQNGILSVTSMNNLVHNPAFSIVPSDICIMFGNVYPLLEYMN